jgi:hypothetical protein
MRKPINHNERSTMKSINVEGIPESVARTFAFMVQTIRQELKAQPERRPRVKLPVYKGKLNGSLSRRDIYAEFGR